MPRPDFLHLGLTGYPLGHSLSPQLHTAALKSAGLAGEYRLYPVEPLPQGASGLEDLASAIRSGRLHGLNLTIPHKQAILPLLDRCTERASRIGAVNTVYIKDGLLTGDNTDAPGFLADLKHFLERLPGRAGYAPGKTLVLGAGGSARAVVYALSRGGWEVTVAARRPEQARTLVNSLRMDGESSSPRSTGLTVEELSCLEQVDLIVNCTPAGMHPAVEGNPWPAELPLPAGAAVYDLVYNPSETSLARTARQAGLPALTGLGMLVEQAALAFEIWTGASPDRVAMRRAVDHFK